MGKSEWGLVNGEIFVFTALFPHSFKPVSSLSLFKNPTFITRCKNSFHMNYSLKNYPLTNVPVLKTNQNRRRPLPFATAIATR